MTKKLKSRRVKHLLIRINLTLFVELNEITGHADYFSNL